jgi:hypothetical protein
MALTFLFSRPGEVKDFVKKVKQEDARIEMRKKALARAAERAAAARAKLAVPKATIPDIVDKDVTMASPKPTSTEETIAAPRDVLDVRPSTPGTTRLTVTSPPLHPSLPPKPGSPAKPQSLSQDVRPSTPAPTPTPAVPPPPPPAVVISPPATESTPIPAPVIVDEQIAKLDEVRFRTFSNVSSAC